MTEAVTTLTFCEAIEEIAAGGTAVAAPAPSVEILIFSTDRATRTSSSDFGGLER